ncbi:MAG: alpha/beta hydrolase, partial [Halobacteriales archaeon]|nr:alpha/beta hydrolase [Halobacteriales archaeon]
MRSARAAEQKAYSCYGLDHREHFVEIAELESRIRVVETGDGPPLVLICGGEGMGLPWLPLLPELDGFTLLVMDRPGGGLSDGVDYHARPVATLATCSTLGLFDHFGLDAAPILGNSMGGLWTLRFAQEHPDRVASIGLLGCPALYPGTSAPLPMRIGSISWLSEFIVETVIQPDSPENFRDGLSSFGHPKETIDSLPDELIEAAYRIVNLPTFKPSWVGLLQRVLRLRGAHPDAAFDDDDLRAIEPPVSLLWGTEDPFGSVETGR